MKRRPRVLVVCSYFPPMPAPEAAHALFLCQRLAARGVDVTLVTDARAGRPVELTFELRPHLWTWGWRGLPKLIRAVWDTTPDAVLLIYVGWLYQFHPMVTMFPLAVQAFRPGTRVVTQFENVQDTPLTWPGWVSGLLRRLGPRAAGTFGALLSASHRLIFLCEQHRRLALPFAPKSVGRAAVIPAPPIMSMAANEAGQARRRGRERLGVAPHTLVVTYFGYIYPSKGVETLLRGLAAAGPQLGDYHLAVVGGPDAGNAYVDSLRRLAVELGVADRVTWTGQCEPDREDASEYLAAADLAALPFDAGVRLHNSSFAVVAAHQLPVVTTAGEDVEAQFRHGENVWLVSPRDPNALAAGLVAAADSAVRERLRGGIGRLADTWFSWNRVVDLTLAELFPAEEVRS